MHGRWFTRALLVPAGLGLLLSAGPATAQSADGDVWTRGRLESEMRSLQNEERALAQRDESSVDRGFDREKLRRIGHGAFSLVLPGWSQYRSGHNGRALAFVSAEAIIWGTWLFSELQGDHRTDQYRDFAGRFADIGDTGTDDDDYWRAVGRYADVEEYNNRVRRDNRAAALEQELNGEPVTVGLNDGTISPEDGWVWSSERRQLEYRDLRADAQSAYDRAEFVLLFALVNRVIAFADAVRSGPGEPEARGTLLRAGGLELGVDVDPRPLDPSASLRLGGRF